VKFPIFKTKVEGLDRKFNLIDPKEQLDYFEAKAGKEIRELREYLKENTFVAYLLGKKNSGKGTYSKMLAQLISPDRIKHFSIGDMVREVDGELKNKEKKKKLIQFLERNYRGRLPLTEIMAALEKRSTKVLLPTELILALVKREMGQMEKKSLFVDGFPRELDQIDFSLFFRDLIGYRDDPDIFVLIDVPEKVIDERIKWRRICPQCKTSRNLRLLPTSKLGFDEKKNEFYLMCDNPDCSGSKMVTKEGDEKGIGPIKKRLQVDEQLIKRAFALHGIPKILLRNCVPTEESRKFIDEYEITPEYVLGWDKKNKKVTVKEELWEIEDDEGTPSYSLLPPPIVVSFIKQLVDVFNL